ncbi:MAG: RNA polymerase sigma factor [Gemmatimonadota bacterium]|nr:RNA polymerase sigma factor [Gemmatimonadota bacterium]
MQRQLELELIRKCKAGQSRFYEPLVRAYEPAGLRLALAMMGNTEDAKDALQMAFIKTYDTLPRFDLRRPFGPWFFQILRNQCRDMLRSRKAKFSMETLDELVELHPADTERGPERIRQRNAAKDLLWRGLAEIGPEHREILVLKELEGFRYGEIAQILDIPEGTVASRLYHARSALKNALVGMDVEYP